MGACSVELMGTDISEYLAERHESGGERIEGDVAKPARGAGTLRAEGELNEFLGSTYMRCDEASFAWFGANSAQLVENAHALTDLQLERVVLALSHPVQERNRTAPEEAR